MWLRKKPQQIERATTCLGFSLGQIVQHKIDQKRMVLTGFLTRDGLPAAEAVFGSAPFDEMRVSLYEIEPLPAPPESK